MTTISQVAIRPDVRSLWAQFFDEFGDVSGMPPAGVNVTFTTSDSAVVNVRPLVDAQGITVPLTYEVCPVAAGTATITAHTDDGGSMSLDVEVDSDGELVATSHTENGKPLIAKDA